MNRLLWRFVDMMFGLLDPDERAVVLGDFAEAGTGPVQALCETAGLVLRRQAAAWRHWGPWLVLAGIVIPLGVLLSHVSRSWADGTAIGAFIYVNNWTWHQLDSVGARRDFIDFLVGVATGSLALIAWSWTAGFVLERLARRTAWTNGALLLVVLFAATLGTTTSARHNVFNGAVFSLTFYSVILPILVRVLLVALPALSGMRYSVRRANLPLVPSVLLAGATSILTVWNARGLESSLVFGRYGWPRFSRNPGIDGVFGTADDPRPLLLASLFIVWPAVYLVSTAAWNRWRKIGSAH